MSESEWEAVSVPIEETPLPFLQISFTPSPCPSCGEEGWLPIAYLPPHHFTVVCKHCFHAKVFKED